MCNACVDAPAKGDYANEIKAGVAKLVDAADLKSASFWSVGSSPTARTKPRHGGRLGMKQTPVDQDQAPDR